MPTWKPLEDYSPFARVLVTYMWDQRPPLLPIEFARQMGIRKQQVSSWLTTQVVPDPPLLVHLARRMGMPVRDLLIAAGHATTEDPLLDTADAWDYVSQWLAEALTTPNTLNTLNTAALVDDEPESLYERLSLLIHTLALHDRQRRTQLSTSSLASVPSLGVPEIAQPADGGASAGFVAEAESGENAHEADGGALDTIEPARAPAKSR